MEVITTSAGHDIHSAQRSDTWVPIGAPVPYATITNFTIADWVQTYAAQKGALNAVVGVTPPKSGTYTVTGLDIGKTNAGSFLYPPYVPITRSYQTSAGVQHDLGHDLFLQADYARRVNINTQLGGVDLNYYNSFVNGIRTPVVPTCKTAPDLNPTDDCSTGSLAFDENDGRGVYNALLVKVQKRLSHRYQFTVSYAYQNLDGLTTLWNINNWNIATGPLIPRQNLNISSVINLPWASTFTGTNSTYTTPIDPTGQYRCFPLCGGKGLSAQDVAAFNATYAGTKIPDGKTVPAYIVPPDYQFGDPTISQDIRLTKTFVYRERYRLAIFGEMFNAFNVANLTGYSANLDPANANPAKQTFAFGQPTQRAGQSLLSSGPRAVQVGARFTF